MGTETPLSLPSIDFSKQNLNPGTEEWESVKSQVFKATQQYGCFEAFYEKVPSELKKGIILSVEELFELTLQTKSKNVSKKPYHGYVGQNPKVPLFESMGIDNADMSENVESFTNNLWPQGNPNFSKTIQSFSERLLELDKIVRRMILESLGVDKYLEEHMNSTYYLLSFIKYKGPKTTETKLGLQPHTDKTTVTILCQNEVDGLQVKTKDGQWIHLKLSPKSFVVLIGDSFHAWTNGRLHSPFHRVMMSGDEARYSAGLFSIPKAGYFIKAPEELVDEQHPLLFKPFDHVQFLDFYYTEAGRATEFPLKTYCGV